LKHIVEFYAPNNRGGGVTWAADIKLLKGGVVRTAMDIFRFDDDTIAIEDKGIDRGGDSGSEDGRALGGSSRGRDDGSSKTGSARHNAAVEVRIYKECGSDFGINPCSVCGGWVFKERINLPKSRGVNCTGAIGLRCQRLECSLARHCQAPALHY
jgi:hypothetical protein